MRRFFIRLIEVDRHLYLVYRISRWFDCSSIPLGWYFAALFRQFNRVWTSCDISPKAQIHSSCEFPHPLCIVIGDGVVIQEGVKIWQGVTLGATGKEGSQANYPTIESGVKLFANSTVLGPVLVGNNSMVGASSLVLTDVAANSTVAGTPARVISSEDC